MRYGIDQITRVYAVRVLFWKNNTPIEHICPYSFIVGKNSDGSCYFRNPYTELPNELNRRSQEYVNDIFENTINVIDEVVNRPQISSVDHVDFIWNFHIWYKNGEEDDLECKNHNIGFEFVNDNDIILNGKVCGGNPFCKTMITLDEFRDEIKSGYVSFKKLYHFFKNDVTLAVENCFVSYSVNLDGSVTIYEGTDYMRSHVISRILISKDGTILEANGMDYVEMLKEKGVKVLLDDLTVN